MLIGQRPAFQRRSYASLGSLGSHRRSSVRQVACDQGLSFTLLVDVHLERQLTNVCSPAAETAAWPSLRGTAQQKTAPRRALQRDDEHHATGAGGHQCKRGGSTSATDRIAAGLGQPPTLKVGTLPPCMLHHWRNACAGDLATERTAAASPAATLALGGALLPVLRPDARREDTGRR